MNVPTPWTTRACACAAGAAMGTTPTSAQPCSRSAHLSVCRRSVSYRIVHVHAAIRQHTTGCSRPVHAGLPNSNSPAVSDPRALHRAATCDAARLVELPEHDDEAQQVASVAGDAEAVQEEEAHRRKKLRSKVRPGLLQSWCPEVKGVTAGERKQNVGFHGWPGKARVDGTA